MLGSAEAARYVCFATLFHEAAIGRRRRGEGGAISDCHPSEATAKIRTQIPIIHTFYFSSALLLLEWISP